MKTLNITKEAFEKSNYFTRKYGKLAFVSESGKLFKTNKGKVLKFAKEAGRKVIPAANGCHIHDMYDCYVVTNKDGLNIGQCRTLSGAKHTAENADEYTAKKLKSLGYDESKKTVVKEGAGAGYTVHIKGLRLGNMLDANRVKDGDGHSYYKLTLEILPGEYEIGAEDYDNDFFWQAHELGEEATAQIDGGVVELDYTGIVHDEGDLEDLFREEIEGREFDIAFRYGWGWTHVYLPNDKPIKSDYIEIEGGDIYGDIDKIELDAPDLADAVNGGYESIFDQGEDDDEDDEEI